MSRWTSGTVDVGYGHLAYHRTGGDRQPLLLAHGLTDNGLCWTRTAEVLQHDFDVVMLDSPGHGNSATPPHGTADNPAADFRRVIDQLDLQSPVVMGHSVGARAVAIFASQHSDLPSRVILEDPPLVPGADSTPAKRQNAFKREIMKTQQHNLDDVIELGRSQHPTWDAAEFPAWARGNLQVNPDITSHYQYPPWQEVLPGIAVPTLLIYGSPARDGLVNQGIAEKARNINPLIQSICIADAGHNVRRENFDDYLAAVQQFLAPMTGENLSPKEPE